jgi:hypothetical protein
MAQPSLDATLATLEQSVSAVEASLAPLLHGQQPLPSVVPTLSPLDSARLHATLASATAVLLASYLRLSGVDTGKHAIAQEFSALQRLGARVKQVAAAAQREEEGQGSSSGAGGGVGQPRSAPSTALNIPASKRVLQAAGVPMEE